MKRIVSLLLIVCMLLASCIAFSSCAKVSAKDAEQDPQAVLGDAISNSSTAFFENKSNKNLGEIISKALESGSLSLTLESGLLKDQTGVGKISEILYMNTKDARIVSDTVVNYNNEDLSARIFMDKNSLILSSESVLGNTNAYALYPATLTEKFPNSTISKRLGLDFSAMSEELTSLLNSVKGVWDFAFASMDPEKANETANEMLAIMKQTTENTKIENADGKSVKCVRISYEITNQTLKDLVNKSLELAQINDQVTKAAVEEILAELDKEDVIDGSLRIDINQKTNRLEAVTLSLAFKDRSNGSTRSNFLAKATFGDDEISFVATVLEGSYKFETSLNLTKTVADDATTYTLTATEADSTGNSATPLTATYVQKDDGSFSLNVTVTEDEDDTTEFALNGTLTVNKKDAIIAITSVKSGEISLELNLTLTFRTEAEMPAAPANAKDILALTEEELQALMSDFHNSKLGKLFTGTPID